MQKWDSRPEKPDNAQWTMFVIVLVIIAAVMAYSLLL